MANNQKKRGRGRPRNQPQSGEALRLKAQASLKASAERRGEIAFDETQEGLELMLDEKRLKNCTKSELKELRRMAERLWDKFQVEKEYAEEQKWQSFGVRQEAVTPEEIAWEKEHEFLKPKRKNAKKTKNIDTLTDKQKLKKGISLEKVPMEFDVDAKEAELNDKLMEEAKDAQTEERKFLKGRRVERRPQRDPSAPPKKNFWI